MASGRMGSGVEGATPVEEQSLMTWAQGRAQGSALRESLARGQSCQVF
jgi:hypothetical protein